MDSLRPENLGSIVSGGKSYSARELREQIESATQEFRAAGAGAVALVQGNEASFFINLFALWELGLCAVPLSPKSTEAELTWCMQHAGVSHIYRDGILRRFDGGGEAPAKSTALLLYTSGSTGKPKGVCLSFSAVSAKMRALLGVLSTDDLANTLCFVPVSFGHGLIGNSLPALWSGQTLHLEDAAPAGIGGYIDTNSITFLSSVPSVWSMVLNFEAPPSRGSLRRAFCASANLSAEEAKAIQAWLGPKTKFKHVYGLTEAASWVSGLGDSDTYDKPGKVGSGWGCIFSIDDQNGEVLLRAPYLMNGYHLDLEATSAVFEKGALRTGDIGELDGGGNLRLLGRLKDQIHRGGLKVSPAEVEERLKQHPSVKDACVFPVPDAVAGESPVAALVLQDGARLDAPALKAFCRETLSEYKIPERFHVLAAIPRNARGKVDKAALAKSLAVGK